MITLLLRSKYLEGNENNAFVRVSTTLNDESLEAGQRRFIAFMEDFYPEFVTYIEEP